MSILTETCHPAPVDDAAEHEGTLTAQDLAQIALGDHQGSDHRSVSMMGVWIPTTVVLTSLATVAIRHQELVRGQRHQNDALHRRSTFSGSVTQFHHPIYPAPP